MKTRVIARDWQGVALDLIAKGVGSRVIYLGEREAKTEPVGFPKEDVFAYQEGVAGRKLSDREWDKLRPLASHEG